MPREKGFSQAFAAICIADVPTTRKRAGSAAEV
jgi:hypothetical protein